MHWCPVKRDYFVRICNGPVFSFDWSLNVVHAQGSYKETVVLSDSMQVTNCLTSYFNGISAIVLQISTVSFVQKNIKKQQHLISSALVLTSVSHLYSDRILRSKKWNALLFRQHAHYICQRSCRHSTANEKFQCRNYVDISTFSEE